MILLFIAALFLFSCGSGESYEETPAPKPPQTGEKLTFNSDVKPLLVTFCDQCHSGATFMASEQAFRASKAPTRIANGSMPQKGSANYNKWGEAQRSTIARFVAQAE